MRQKDTCGLNRSVFGAIAWRLAFLLPLWVATADGAFARTDHGPNYWTDNRTSGFAEKNYPGAKTVNRWREAYLRDWQQRMEQLKK